MRPPAHSRIQRYRQRVGRGRGWPVRSQGYGARGSELAGIAGTRKSGGVVTALVALFAVWALFALIALILNGGKL